MKIIDTVVGALLVVAGLNCGLIALFQYDLLTVSSPAASLTRLFFGLVGVAAAYCLIAFLLQPSKAVAMGRRQPY